LQLPYCRCLIKLCNDRSQLESEPCLSEMKDNCKHPRQCSDYSIYNFQTKCPNVDPSTLEQDTWTTTSELPTVIVHSATLVNHHLDRDSGNAGKSEKKPAPKECLDRRDARLQTITNKCCRQFLYCRCVKKLCTAWDQLMQSQCKGEMKFTCVGMYRKQCPHLNKSSFVSKCPGVSITILEKDKWKLTTLTPTP